MTGGDVLSVAADGGAMVDPVPLAVRALHVLAMAGVVGGAAAAWHGCRSGSVGVAAAGRYERAFWAAMGVLVLTGVGNLGAIGAPGPATAWGRTLLAKLLLVVAVVCGSAVRTLVVVRAGNAGADRAAVRRTLARAYGATTGVLVIVVILAEVLAHG